MKKMLWLVLFVAAAFSVSAQAGTTSKKKVAKKTTSKKPAVKKDSSTVVLTNTSVNAAYSAAPSRLRISDPTITALNQKALGAPLRISSSGIVGVPKGTYGYANGEIWLRPTTATTSGTVFGTGSVGTGTSIQGVGTSEATIGVNGKNPYVGPGLWGSSAPVASPLASPLKINNQQ